MYEMHRTMRTLEDCLHRLQILREIFFYLPTVSPMLLGRDPVFPDLRIEFEILTQFQREFLGRPHQLRTTLRFISKQKRHGGLADTEAALTSVVWPQALAAGIVYKLWCSRSYGSDCAFSGSRGYLGREHEVELMK